MSAPARSAPRLLVAVAVVFVLLVAGLGATSLIAQGFRSTSDYSSTLTPQADRLTVRNPLGDVRLAPSSDGLVHVYAQSEHGVSEPRLVEESTPTGVRLEAECVSELAIGCSVDYTIQVPRSFAVRVEAEGGEVYAQDLTGGLSLQIGSGDVVLRDLAGPLDVRSRSGVVDAYQLRSDTVLMNTGSGDVDLQLLAVPTSVQVHAEHGEVEIAVPATERYRVNAHTAGGTTQIGVGTDLGSPNTITASSDTGDIHILPSLPGLRAVPVPPVAPDAPGAPLPPRAPELVFPPFRDGPG